MSPVKVLSHMALFSVLVLMTLFGLAAVEENGGGYLWELFAVGSPFLIGMQIQYILNYAGEQQ